MRLLSHHYRSGYISSETIVSSPIFKDGWRTWFVEWLGIQVSLRIRIKAPLPTLQHAPHCSIGLAAMMLFHTKELLGESVASKKWHLEKYRGLKHWNSKDFQSCINLQPCFTNMARLNCPKSLNLISPSDFGIVSLSQLSQWIFLSFPIRPHQNLAHMDWSSSHNLIGSWNTPIVLLLWSVFLFPPLIAFSLSTPEVFSKPYLWEKKRYGIFAIQLVSVSLSRTQTSLLPSLLIMPWSYLFVGPKYYH